MVGSGNTQTGFAWGKKGKQDAPHLVLVFALLSPLLHLVLGLASLRNGIAMLFVSLCIHFHRVTRHKGENTRTDDEGKVEKSAHCSVRRSSYRLRHEVERGA